MWVMSSLPSFSFSSFSWRRCLTHAQRALWARCDDRIGMAVRHFPGAVLAQERGGGSQAPMRHRTAANADLPVLHLEDRGQIVRHVAPQAVEAQERAIAEPRRGVVQGCRSR